MRLEKLEFAYQRDRDGIEYVRIAPGLLLIAERLNEVIEAVNNLQNHPTWMGGQHSVFRASQQFVDPRESPQQERGETLDEAISSYATILRNHERRKVDGLAPYPRGVGEARDAIFSAAQREYSPSNVGSQTAID